MPKVRLVAFDLDDTLAPSKSPIPAAIADALRRLLDVAEVCVISGGQWQQFRDQVLAHLDAEGPQLDRLHLMPTCGTRYIRWDGDEWAQVYAQPLDEQERIDVARELERVARELGLWEAEPWGDIIEDRGTQITFSALGQRAPLEAKRAWDPDGTKRLAIVREMEPLFPELEIRSGGSTSVDITRRGIDKAYGMLRLGEQTGIALGEMVFVGDRLDPDGNDYPVKKLGVECIAVTGPEETAEVIDDLISRVTGETR